MPHNSFTGRFEVSQWSCGQTEVQTKSQCQTATSMANYLSLAAGRQDPYDILRRLVTLKTHNPTITTDHEIYRTIRSLLG